jgi:hypothetical protein
MSNQTRSYEPLTSQNAALVLVDHQVGLMTGVRDYSTGELKHNVVALVFGWCVMNIDITEQRQAKTALKRRARTVAHH